MDLTLTFRTNLTMMIVTVCFHAFAAAFNTQDGHTVRPVAKAKTISGLISQATLTLANYTFHGSVVFYCFNDLYINLRFGYYNSFDPDLLKFLGTMCCLEILMLVLSIGAAFGTQYYATFCRCLRTILGGSFAVGIVVSASAALYAMGSTTSPQPVDTLQNDATLLYERILSLTADTV
ncbi:hypothetical protein TRVA0_038S01090 [Trichomonascus vanleenenianus]|uniref:uncharacterized protein n=1 Tax=Trichomonascus vanleenenianus TaxID=2268995 RepID=UPI003EC959D3